MAILALLLPYFDSLISEITEKSDIQYYTFYDLDLKPRVHHYENYVIDQKPVIEFREFTVSSEGSKSRGSLLSPIWYRTTEDLRREKKTESCDSVPTNFRFEFLGMVLKPG